MNQTDTRTITADQAAEYLGFAAKVTVLKLLGTGELTGYKLTRGETAPWRVYASSVEKYARDVQRREIKIPA